MEGANLQPEVITALVPEMWEPSGAAHYELLGVEGSHPARPQETCQALPFFPHGGCSADCEKHSLVLLYLFRLCFYSL